MGPPCAPPCSVLSPHQYGLYSAFMGCFVYFFLGTSRDVTLGPTAIMSLLVSFYTFHEPAYAVLLAFLSGCIQLAMGFLRLGKTLGPSCQGVPRHLPPGDGPTFSLSCFVSQGLFLCVCEEGFSQPSAILLRGQDTWRSALGLRP